MSVDSISGWSPFPERMSNGMRLMTPSGMTTTWRTGPLASALSSAGKTLSSAVLACRSAALSGRARITESSSSISLPVRA